MSQDAFYKETKPQLPRLFVLALAMSLSSAMHATTDSDKIDALEKRVRMLEKLLTSQIQANKKTTPRLRPAVIHSPGKPVVRTMPVKTATPPPPSSPSSQSVLAQDKKIHLGSLVITPGGFFAGEGLFRSRNEQTDIGSTFSGIPLGNAPLYYMKEARMSARQSRLAALVEGQMNPDTLLSGYVEMDFLGNGTANSNESNSFDMRMREFYGTVDWNARGLHLLFGQNWSLAIGNLKGITPRNEPNPPTIDAQYVVGFVWKRQAQLRLVKNLGSKLSAAISIENAQTTFGGTSCGTVLGNGVINQVCTAPGVQTLPFTTNFSLNNKPDVIGKLAYETVFATHKVHLEGFGLYRSFYNRVQWAPNSNLNHNRSAGGFGGSTVVEVLPGLLDAQGNVLGGRGIGSYASGLLPDATLAANGSLAPIPELVFMLGTTLHVSKKLDLYLFGGREREQSKYFQIGNNYFGYGAPNANNSGCSIENTGVCAGNTQALWQITTGLWNKFYQGAYGELRGGLQYSYTERKLFPGTGGQANMAVPKNIGYKTNDQMVFASLRYYPFTPSPAVHSK